MELTTKRVKASELKKSEVKTSSDSKVTVRRVRSFKLRPASSNYDFRKRFTLWGTVQKIAKSGEAVLVTCGESTTNYWLDIEKDSYTFKEGDICRFEITISTFVGKDKVIRTKLRVLESTILPANAKEELANGFNEGSGILDVEIVGSQRTDTPGLFLVTMQRVTEAGEAKEFYYMRYFAKDRLHVDLGHAKVIFKLGKTKDLITDKGEIYTDVETRTFVDENGETVTKESSIYVPALQIKEILV